MNTALSMLPGTLEERVELVLSLSLSPQKSRLMQYLLAHPGAYTHQLAMHCRVGYPPNRIGELNKDVLFKYGLFIRCTPPPADYRNSFGERSQVHRWELVKVR